MRVAAAAVLLAALACGRDEPEPVTVSVRLLAFDPSPLTVEAGTTVVWRNDEPIGHTVTSGEPTGVDAATGLRSGQVPDGRFDAPLATKGATFAHRFTDPGTYSYYCAIHLGMSSRVVVT